MPRTIGALTLIPCLLALAPVAAHAAGGSRVEEPTPAAEPSPEQQAMTHYNDGLAYRDQAWKLQDKIDDGEISEAKLAKTRNKLRGAYERAVKEFTAAIELNPRFHQAYGSLGYAQRQLGDYASALTAYDRALELAPDYVEAIEYRAEAYLGLNRINDAQNAFRVLQTKDPKLAAELLQAMQTWVAQRRGESGGSDVADLDGLERWIEDRDLALGEGSSLRKSRTW